MGSESRYSIVQDITQSKNECLDVIDRLKTEIEDSKAGLDKLEIQHERQIETLEKKIAELDKALDAIKKISETAQ